jgi:DNA-binding Lrp family transcriptional regulator
VLVDATDNEILRLLRADGRASFTDLGKALETSEGTIRGRVRKLVEEGTIRKFTIETKGQFVKALIEVHVEAHVHSPQVAGEIRGWEGVEHVWEVTGEDDIVVVADCQDMERLNLLIDNIRAVQGTASTRSRLILQEF